MPAEKPEIKDVAEAIRYLENTYDQLKREARDKAWFRGHHPKFTRKLIRTVDHLTGISECDKCDGIYYVDTNNSVGFWGTMIEFDCPFKKGSKRVYLVVVDDPKEVEGINGEVKEVKKGIGI